MNHLNKGQEFASNVLNQMISTVEHLQRNTIAHRDIKPENIVICHVLLEITKGSDEIMRFWLGFDFLQSNEKHFLWHFGLRFPINERSWVIFDECGYLEFGSADIRIAMWSRPLQKLDHFMATQRGLQKYALELECVLSVVPLFNSRKLYEKYSKIESLIKSHHQNVSKTSFHHQTSTSQQSYYIRYRRELFTLILQCRIMYILY